jgi:FKBP-type peptidyl-prolyl cis-trans isomerase
MNFRILHHTKSTNSFLIFASGLLLVTCYLLSSCSKTSTAEQDKIDDAAITNYLTKHAISASKTTSGLYYTIEEPGTGMQVSPNNTVLMKYKGYLLDTTVFDESKTGVYIQISNTIKGWQEGIPKFKVGGKGKLFIPSKLAYGNQKTGKIPANSVLIFDVEVIEIK